MKTLLVQKWQELMRLPVIREPICGMTRHYMGGSNSPSIFQTTRRTSYVLRYVNPAQLTFARTKCTARLTARRQIYREDFGHGRGCKQTEDGGISGAAAFPAETGRALWRERECQYV